MKDFTRILQDYCNANNISYHYGNRQSLNLLQSDTDVGKIYLFHDATSLRRGQWNTTNTKIESYLFIGKFFLIVKSTMDMPYFNEKQLNDDTSKYTINIEPLLDIYELIGNHFGCTDVEITQWESQDVVNIFDKNTDGLMITYTAKSYE